MADATFSLVSSLWRVASAVAIIVIGVASLSGGRARPRGAFAFGAFAIAWGLQITLGNAIMMVPAPWAATTFLLFVACSMPATFLLVEFVVSQAPDAQARRWRALRIAAAAVTSVGAASILLFPQGYLAHVQYSATHASLTRGPLYFWLFILPQFVAFGIATWVLYRAWRSAPSPRTSVRVAALLVGFGLYLGCTAGAFAVRYTASVLTDGPAERLEFAALFVALALVLAAISVLAWRAGSGAKSRGEARQRRVVASLLGVALGWGVLEGLLAAGPFPLFSTQGLWRLAGMAVIAYGLAQWRLPDLPQRATRAAAAGAGASAAAAGGIAIYGATTLVSASPAIPVVVGVLTVSLSMIPGLRLARRLFERVARPAWTDDSDSVYASRIDAYRAALESSLARGTLEEDADFLSALRERFAITDSEDRLLRHYAKACILAPRAGDADSVYERLRLLGEGGAGRTWLARDRVRDRLVVLKEPLERWQREPTLREAVLREARLATRVRHGNVVRVEEVIEHRGAPIIVMEFAEGGSLAELLRRRGVLPWREALELILPVLRGVEAVHQAGIVHRDLKPSNVLLTLDGEPKIADFGIAVAARSLQQPEASDRTVVEGTTFVGTYAYLAPEVRAGSPGDKRSDVYACAAMLHEMLYGSPPGLRLPVLAQNDAPAQLTRALARALSADPAARPPSARALAEELTLLAARPRGT